MNRIARLCIFPVLAAALTACSESPPESTQAPASHDWLLTSAPDNAEAVADAKSTAAEGDTIAVLGRIGGRVEPIAPDSTVFTIVDLGVQHCGQMAMDDGCQTPWDYCCEPKESLTANSATVQLVDENGEPMTIDPIAAGLHPLDEVIVVGTVGPRPNNDILTIHATAVYRNPG